MAILRGFLSNFRGCEKMKDFFPIISIKYTKKKQDG